MRERPILMSKPMVLSLLRKENPKTKTRRIVKLRGNDGLQDSHADWRFCEFHDEKAVWQHRTNIKRVITETCPYGVSGDRLWVKETFGLWRKTSVYCDEFEAGKEALRGLTIAQHEVEYGHSELNIAYRADADDEYPWYPSIFMPRWASRLTLEVTEIRVERLQDISEEDAIAEGVERWVVGEGWREYGLSAEDEAVCGPPMPTARESYRTLWESINGEGSWAANPYVWCVSFQVVK